MRSLRLSIVRHMSMIDSDSWKWTYVEISLERLDCNRNSFISSSISKDLLFDLAVISFHVEWWIFRSLIIMWSLNCSFDDDFKAERKFCKTKNDKMFDSLYTLCRCKWWDSCKRIWTIITFSKRNRYFRSLMKMRLVTKVHTRTRFFSISIWFE